MEALIALTEFGIVFLMVGFVFWLLWQFIRGAVDIVADYWQQRHVYYKLPRHLSEMRSHGKFCCICINHLETRRPNVYRELTLGTEEK